LTNHWISCIEDSSWPKCGCVVTGTDSLAANSRNCQLVNPKFHLVMFHHKTRPTHSSAYGYLIVS
jgi:hypothetical protein